MKTFLRRLAILNYLRTRHQATGTDLILTHLIDAGYLAGRGANSRSQLRLIQRDLCFLVGTEDEDGEPDNEFGLMVERGESKSRLWRLDPYQPLNVDFERMPAFMALALSLTEKHLTQVLPSTTRRELGQVFQNAEAKLQQSERKLSPLHYHRLTDAVEFFQRGQTLQAADVDISMLDKIYQAILLGKRVDIEYRSAAGISHYHLHPFGVAILLPKLYLIAKKDADVDSEPDSNFRSFLLHKIVAVELSAFSNRVPKDFKLKSYLDAGNMDVLIDREDSTPYALQLKLNLTAKAKLLADLRESPISQHQQLLQQDDQSWLLEAQVRRTVQLKNWLLSLGAVAQVLGPQVIRDDIVNSLDQMRQVYNDQPKP